ncbi:endonuclease/exonuclease/phosphatase family protein [Wenyingzhuangia marina]|uniref:Endonuclease/Exonuclease/phosphatase family protein n=1 Tax=Wenyingzhuangia marina TaxID=1195760 RepID=A0A1M5SAA1_9FLAO|nr:endonuclease [Wenyingzhuangia marina]GGF61361.1 endonuclease [Wenyingzhuangia marina]SHH35218.1 Endonuclease/Exonuclease/phosphatase family protein [Wenyingzhuangia marina]
MLLKINQITLIILLLSCNILNAQKSYIVQTVAFYNLENLFDTINNPEKMDELSPMMEIKSNRKEIYLDKLSKLAHVLCDIGKEQNKLPPTIIGIAEVENKKVLEDLIATSPLSDYPYGIIHYDSPDQRGIDTALLYNKDIFKPIYSEAIPANLYNDNVKIHTRDILLVSGFLMNEKIHVLVNHWPSRRGGVKKSSILRERVAQKNLDIIAKIRKEEPNAKIIGMGDFNDNPNDKSFKKVLNTKASKNKLKPEDLYNPFEKMFKEGFNTLTYKSDLFLFDQIFFSDNFITLNKDYQQFKFYKAGIFNPSYMTLQKGQYKGSPKRSFSGSIYLGGYSDHYPVYCYLLKENKSN